MKKDVFDIIKPQNFGLPSETIEVSMSYLSKYLDDMNTIMPVELNPDFQRGHIWTQEQQIAYVENMFRGFNTDRNIYFNQYGYHEIKENNKHLIDHEKGVWGRFLCLDGLQRLTAVLAFTKNEFAIFDQQILFQDILSDSRAKRKLLNQSMTNLRFNYFQFKTREEILTFYLALNSGGTPHTQEEIQRVQQLLVAETSA